MVYSDINHLSSNLNSLRLDASSNMEGELSSIGDSPISSAQLPQQDNQNAVVMSPEEALVKLSEKTKYPIMQENGQRRYGPPPDWHGIVPQRGCEVFIGKIPRDCFEDELVPIFETVGKIYMFRLMMDFSGSNRGYGFCIYTNREDTKRAVHELDNYEIRKGKMLGVCLSVDNCRLFVGGIPKTKTKEEIMVEMIKVTEGVKDVIVYPSAADKTKNRGFAFVEYDNHKAAAMARRKLIPGRIQLWGHQIAVDWAEPEREVDEDVMSKVKILYVRNLMLSTSEETLRDHFNLAACSDAVERVKKIRDYAFVHFRERDQAGKALRDLDDTELEGSRIEVSWAKPVEKTEYVRYTRNGTKNIQLQVATAPTSTAFAPATSQQIFLDPYLTTYASLYAATTPQATVAQVPASISPNESRLITLEESDNENDISNLMRANVLRGGRSYRNAAGSRSATTRTNIPGYNVRDKKHPVEKLQQHQTNPLSHTEILEDMCQKNGWGIPSYTTTVSEVVDPTTGGKMQFYLGQVTLPNLCRQFQAPRAFLSPDDAKLGAAEYVVQLMQYSAQSLEGQTCGPTQPPPGSLFHIAQTTSAQLAYPQSQSALLAPGSYPTYATYSYSPIPPNSSQSSLSAATTLPLLSAGPPETQQLTPFLYDPTGLVGANAAQTFINPMAFTGAELYSHY